jgi:hypothetical protein
LKPADRSEPTRGLGVGRGRVEADEHVRWCAARGDAEHGDAEQQAAGSVLLDDVDRSRPHRGSGDVLQGLRHPSRRRPDDDDEIVGWRTRADHPDLAPARAGGRVSHPEGDPLESYW